jgi:RHS repeat-associated protein
MTETSPGLASLSNFTAFQKPGQIAYGNGITDTFEYDTRLRIYALNHVGQYAYNIQTGSSTGYAPNGDILFANDSANGNWAYTYDDMNRVISGTCSANCPATAGFTYTYDRFGNRHDETVTAGSGVQPEYAFNANNQIDVSGVTYDAAGNVIADGVGLGNTYTYDAENRIITAANGYSASYVYDAFGHRVRATVNGQTRDFLYDLNGRTIDQLTGGSLTRSEAYAEGMHLATYANSTTAFDNSDWLGTSRVRSNVSGTNIESCTSLPFGEDLTCNSADVSPLHFTGQEHDSESGDDHFPFRYYSETMARWVTPDPAGLGAVDPTNPQTWNRYAYVMNSPLNYIDPLGLGGCDGRYNGAPCLYVPNNNADLNAWIWELALTGVVTTSYNYVNGDLTTSQVLQYPFVDLLGLIANGPGGSANNGTPQVPQQPTRTHCLGQAAAAKGLSIALDVAGAIPGFGNLFSGTVEGIQGLNAGYYGLVALSNAGNTLLNPSASGAANTAATVGLTAASLVFQGSKVIPFVGTLVSLGSLAYDATKAVQAYQQCMAGPG